MPDDSQRDYADSGDQDSASDAEMSPMADVGRSRLSAVERIRQMSADIERLSRERNAIAKQLDQQNDAVEVLTSKLKMTEVDLGAARKELDLLRAERENVAMRLQREGERSEELAAKVKMVEVERDAARKEVDLQGGEKGRLQAERAKLLDELRGMKSELESVLRVKHKLQTELSAARSALQDIERAFGK